jgi:alanine racemase
LITDYCRDGFAFRPAVLSGTEAGALVSETERLSAGERAPDRFLFEKDGATIRTIVNPHLYSDVFERLVAHPRLLVAAQELLDDEVYVFQMGINNKASFNGDVWFWHQDYPGYHHDDHILEPRMVNTLIFLDEVSDLNGPLMVVPGSYRHVPERPEVSDKGTSYSFRYADNETVTELVGRGGIVAPTGPAGSVLFMNVNTLHGSTANLSPWPRRMITLTYNAMSNKATSRSTRPSHIVYDDRDLPAITPLGENCLTDLARPDRLTTQDPYRVRKRQTPQHDRDGYADARPVWADVDLGAITHNIDLLRERAGRAVKLLVPVKANAYGHGAAAVGKHLESLGVEGLATANVDDAIAIREAGVTLPILLYGAQLPSGNRYLLQHDLTPTVYSVDSLQSISGLATDSGRIVDVHIKVDAGMGRLGVRLDEAAEFARTVIGTPNVRLEGIYTHIPFSDGAGEEWSRRRIIAFTDVVKSIETEHRISIDFVQAAASSVLAQGLPDVLNTIAPGHITFGLHPIGGARAEDSGYRKALAAIRAAVIHVGRRRRGDDLLGAGPAGVAADATVGVILLGMDNGYRQGPAGSGAYMLCRGRRCAVLSVSAEYTVIDLTGIDDPVVGDIVTLIGRDGDEEISVETVAQQLGAPSAAYWMVGLKNVPYRYCDSASV